MSTTTNPAQNICKDDLPSGRANFHCSLVCCGAGEENGGMGWPMHSGNLQVWLYSEDCGSEEPGDTRLWQPAQFNIPLSCSQDANPNEYTCTWTGRLDGSTDQGTCLVGDVLVSQGYRIRLTGTMTAIDFNTVSASFTLERLAAGSDFTPPQADNQWITCGTGGATCYRIVAPGDDPNDKQIPRTFTSDLITLGSPGSICGDAKFAKIVVILLPWEFGCHVDATLCALAQSGSYYSCLQTYIEPISIPQDTEPSAPSWPFRPQFAQIGVFDPFDVSQCLEGHSNDPGVDTSIYLCGCPGEGDDVKQQIQYRTGIAGFELIVKSVEGESGLCVALRVAGVGSYSVQTPTTLQSVAPWIAYADFAGLGGRVKLFGLKFPEGAVADCVVNGTYVPPPEPTVYNYWCVCSAGENDAGSFCLPYPEGEDPTGLYDFVTGPFLTTESCAASCGTPESPAFYCAAGGYCWLICVPGVHGGTGEAYCYCSDLSTPPVAPSFIIEAFNGAFASGSCSSALGMGLVCDELS